MKRLIVSGDSAKREVRTSDSVIYFYISTTLDWIGCIRIADTTKSSYSTYTHTHNVILILEIIFVFVI